MSDNTSLAALKPCPFCGSTDLFEDKSYTGYVVSCDDCSAKGSRADWQTRAADQRCAESEAENAQLRELAWRLVDAAADVRKELENSDDK